MLAGAGLDQVIIAADIGAIPPAGFNAFRAHQDLHAGLSQQGRFSEQPAGALHTAQARAWATVSRGLPSAFGAMLGVKAQALHRLIPQARAQAFAQLLPRQGLLRAVVEQVLALRHEHRQVLGAPGESRALAH